MKWNICNISEKKIKKKKKKKKKKRKKKDNDDESTIDEIEETINNILKVKKICEENKFKFEDYDRLVFDPNAN